MVKHMAENSNLPLIFRYHCYFLPITNFKSVFSSKYEIDYQTADYYIMIFSSYAKPLQFPYKTLEI